MSSPLGCPLPRRAAPRRVPLTHMILGSSSLSISLSAISRLILLFFPPLIPPPRLFPVPALLPISQMQPTAFVTSAPLAARRAGLAVRSVLFGRPVQAHCVPTRRAFVAPVSLADADAPVPQPEPAVDDTEAQPVAEDVTPEPVAEDVSPEPIDEDVSPEPVAPVAPVAAEAADDQTEEQSSDDTAGADRKRRRRTRTKRVVTLPLEDLVVGQEIEGTVKSVMNYGAFVGGMGTPTDGLLHVSQLAAGFVENVSDIVKEGDKVTVRVLAVDLEKGTFSLTMKTAEEMAAPPRERRGSSSAESKAESATRREEQKQKWEDFTFDPAVFIDAKVMSVTDFGGFCQLLNEEGEALETAPTDGLIHISELSESRVEKVSDVLSEGQIVKVRIVSTDRKRNRISMSLKPMSEDKPRYNSRSEGGSGGPGGSGDSASIAEDMASAQANQPAFKTVFELAFEKAQTVPSN